MSALVEPRSGRVIGRYVLHDEIASGGMATVHLGRLLGSAGFARTVAVKCLQPGMTKDPEFVSMLLDEAHLASRVRHPNVVQTLDVVSIEGDIFLVMEYVHGESLARLLQSLASTGERMPLPVVVGVMAGMLFGLHAAHEATTEQGEPLGIVHRDVSPQNLLVAADGIARVLDFGVAKAASRLQSTGDGQLKGKLRYMAPEQLRSRPVDRRSDVFAAAAVLWECLTGRRLFDGPDPGAIVTKILMHDVPAPSKIGAGVPEALDAITLRGLAADPAERFLTAREMAVALERAVTPATAREVGEWVEQVAGDALKRRAALVSAIEGKVAGARAGAVARAEEATAPFELARDTPHLGSGDPGRPTDETVTAKMSDTVPVELEGTSRTSALALAAPEPYPRRRTRVAGIALLGSASIGAAIWGWLVLGSPERAAPTRQAIEPASETAVPIEPPSVGTTAPAMTVGPAAPASPASASAAPPPRPPAHAIRRDCDPPFVIKNGIKEFKRQCL